MKHPVRKEYEDSSEMTLVWLLRDINQMAQSRLTQSLAQYGLYIGQPRILRLIHDYPGKTQKQIAEKLYVSGASLSNSLRRLQKANLVERRQSRQDRREHELYLTPAGIDAVERCGNDLRTLFGHMMSSLDREEVQQLLSSLKTIHNTLASMSEDSVNSLQTGACTGAALFDPSENNVQTGACTGAALSNHSESNAQTGACTGTALSDHSESTVQTGARTGTALSDHSENNIQTGACTGAALSDHSENSIETEYSAVNNKIRGSFNSDPPDSEDNNQEDK
ncbi:MAG TPA: winged helix-turn-helix transcriptional regulator [Clostridiaceae bacterium]|nr:winged helix-turn-helix transcriptional regulator [Clostridiaceae bacterium]